MAEPAIDAAIAAAWPEKWAKANADRPGASKRRNNLRKSWAASQELAAFKAAHPHASCGNCDNHATHFSQGDYCLLESDFHGLAVIRDISDVCARHAPMPGADA